MSNSYRFFCCQFLKRQQIGHLGYEGFGGGKSPRTEDIRAFANYLQNCGRNSVEKFCSHIINNIIFTMKTDIEKNENIVNVYKNNYAHIPVKPIYPVLPPGADKRKKLSPLQIQEIQRLKKMGISDKKIALQFGINKSTARYWSGDKERQNQKTTRRLKLKPVSKEELARRRRECYLHRKEVHGEEAVLKFQRENKRATRKLYPDYRTTCKACKGRYSRRLHQSCPYCNAEKVS